MFDTQFLLLNFSASACAIFSSALHNYVTCKTLNLQSATKYPNLCGICSISRTPEIDIRKDITNRSIRRQLVADVDIMLAQINVKLTC